MNIRSIASILSPQPIRPKDKKAGEASKDRDPQNQQQAEDHRRRNLSEQELLEAMEYLRGLQGVKDNNLTVRLDKRDGINVLYIEDSHGKVVRRIPEAEIALLNRDKEQKKGQIFDKAL